MPRQKYITANTKEYIFASYEESWRMKVERIGNINYPEHAIRNNLTGTLLLDVAINPDGSLHDVRVIRSSGSKVLDDGAIYIVELSAPFSPFTPQMRKETDILHITRAWQFKNDNRLTTR
jgi:protein TonB